jgi:single-strand DNA-binding protein
VTAWRKQAELCNQFLSKGRLVMVEGEISEPKTYQANDGTWKASLDVTAAVVKFLDKHEGGETGAAVEDEQVPF